MDAIIVQEPDLARLIIGLGERAAELIPAVLGLLIAAILMRRHVLPW